MPIPYAEPGSIADRAYVNAVSNARNNSANQGNTANVHTTDQSPHGVYVVPFPPNVIAMNIEVDWIARDATTITNTTGGRTICVAHLAGGVGVVDGFADFAKAGGASEDFAVEFAPNGAGIQVNAHVTGVSDSVFWTCVVYVYPALL